MNLKKLVIFIYILPSLIFGSVSFDGADDYLDCGTGLVLDKTNMASTAWVNPVFDTEPFPRATIFSYYSDSLGIQYEMYLDDGTPYGSVIVLTCDLLDSGGSLNTTSMDYGDATGWKHVACVWDGTNLTPYVDASAGTPVAISDSAETSEGLLTIGAQSGPLYFFQGEISDVNFYVRKLDLSDIETLFYSRMRGDVVPTQSRTGHWPLDDYANGTTVNTSTFLNRADPGNPNCSGSASGAGGTAYADFIRYR